MLISAGHLLPPTFSRDPRPSATPGSVNVEPFLGIMAQSGGTYDAICDEDTRTFEVPADALSDLLEDQFECLLVNARHVKLFDRRHLVKILHFGSAFFSAATPRGVTFVSVR